MARKNAQDRAREAQTKRMGKGKGEIPMTPRMRQGLADLLGGQDLAFEHTGIGRPTKQRLAKYGLARFLKAREWDGPMEITAAGRRMAARLRIEPQARQERPLGAVPGGGWSFEQVGEDAAQERSQGAFPESPVYPLEESIAHQESLTLGSAEQTIRAELRAKRPDDSARVDEYVDEGIEQEGLDDFLARPFQERLADFDLYLSLVPAPGEA